jgi:hypothetical protein
MKPHDAADDRAGHRVPRTLRATALALAVTVAFGSDARAEKVSPPPVPAGLEVDAGSRAFLVGHAVGTQNYVCLPSGTGYAWSLFTPEATLFSARGRQLTTHFFSPNPDEGGTVRPAWQHSRDTSSVWVRLGAQSSDSAYVESGAIPWLLLDVAGTEAGPNGGNALTATTQIQRLNTSGGIAPATGCAVSTDLGKRAFVPYTADYFFYSKREHDEEDED